MKLGRMAAAMSSVVSHTQSINELYDTFKVGRKCKKTRAERLQAKRILIDDLEERRYKLLAWQTKSSKARNEALERLSLQVRVLSPAAKRNVKDGILGRKGGLKV